MRMFSLGAWERVSGGRVRRGNRQAEVVHEGILGPEPRSMAQAASVFHKLLPPSGNQLNEGVIGIGTRRWVAAQIRDLKHR